MFAKAKLFVKNRCANGASALESSATHVAPSAEPSSRQSWGSRSGTSFALVSEYEDTAIGSARSACQITSAGGAIRHHFVPESPSYVFSTLSPPDTS